MRASQAGGGEPYPGNQSLHPQPSGGRRAFLLALLLGVLACVGAIRMARADGRSFVFKIPPGWTDLSPDVPAAALKKLPRQVLQAREGRDDAVFAMDLRSPDGGAAFSVAVIEAPPELASELASAPALQGLLDILAIQLPEKSTAAGVQTSVVEKKLITKGTVQVARLTLKQRDVRDVRIAVNYLLPGPGAYAILSYSVKQKAFARYQPVFETSALTTEGIVTMDAEKAAATEEGAADFDGESPPELPVPVREDALRIGAEYRPRSQGSTLEAALWGVLGVSLAAALGFFLFYRKRRGYKSAETDVSSLLRLPADVEPNSPSSMRTGAAERSRSNKLGDYRQAAGLASVTRIQIEGKEDEEGISRGVD